MDSMEFAQGSSGYGHIQEFPLSHLIAMGRGVFFEACIIGTVTINYRRRTKKAANREIGGFRRFSWRPDAPAKLLNKPLQETLQLLAADRVL